VQFNRIDTLLEGGDLESDLGTLVRTERNKVEIKVTDTELLDLMGTT